MGGPVEEEFEHFAKLLNDSKYTKEESITILSQYVKSLVENFVPLANRPHASIVTGTYIKRLLNHEWKFAHNLFGNWVNSVEDSDQDVGC